MDVCMCVCLRTHLKILQVDKVKFDKKMYSEIMFLNDCISTCTLQIS